MTTRKKEEEDVDSVEKKDFEIDWKSVMEDDENDGTGKEDKVPELEIVNAKTLPPPPPLSTFLSADQMNSQKTLSDHALDELLERNKSHLVKLGPSLPDNGEKIRSKIASLEEEKRSRALRRSKMDVERSSTLMHATSSDVFARGNAASKDSSRQGNAVSKEVSRSTFRDAFLSKPKTDTQSTTKAFAKELEDLGCESGKRKADYKKTVTRPKGGWRMLSDIGKAEHSEKQFYSGSKGSKGNQKSKESYGKRKPKESSTYSLLDDDDNDDANGHETPREWSWEEYPAPSSRRRKISDNTVINVDEEELQPSTVAEQAVEIPEGLPEEICYPSRDDPDFVQVCLKDLECLGPQEFLTSPVMNFYIRFLQQQVSAANQISADCHFFNTYFYKKLSDAVTYKGNDKDAFFVKFRRWWKGVDLFRKAYIFIPIHEDLHWSLVIVCIPDKEDESGLTILHLDSLGLHSKRSILDNVKRFLKDEWIYLKQDDYSSNLPISENIWKNLPRRISEADIQVPQQKNDFDCGPFVLFFIKRFIEEAPQRLKRKDLGMFDKKWFRPDEASALRIRIRNTLIDLFRVSNEPQ
ncbi:hypothetical protein EUTSA_v10023376mg [Eutrema salsugineum]|uniref:Ubiquitin-like protease family profile domain-containing protein n=1 Tax=Eutrema salsugineum TaxID=72664 RepID=V4KE68_EUTSA|nr:ubiquitin-like-specific protease 1D isoform X2 [Eutrema salsugineum]ESQ29464.1 hypothetical protein EUTSA_v10023376mg [Eutrema salsugineum]